jgi:hypothetical protein
MKETSNNLISLKWLSIFTIGLFLIISIAFFFPLVIQFKKFLPENDLDYTWIYLIFAASILGVIALLGIFTVQIAKINAQRAKEKEEVEEKRRLTEEESTRFEKIQSQREVNTMLDRADSFARYLIEKEVVGKFANEDNLKPRLEIIMGFMRDYMDLPDNPKMMNENNENQ